MALLDIIEAPDPRLKTVCTPVATVNAEIRQLMDDMLATMYAAPGIGLSAPQVGDTRRVIVVDTAADPQARQPLRMANPEVVWSSGEMNLYEEGCLSFPSMYAEVHRPRAIRVTCLDETGTRREVAADGLLATCIQHEIDHLDGVLFVDRIGHLRRNLIMRKMRKARRRERVN